MSASAATPICGRDNKRCGTVRRHSPQKSGALSPRFWWGLSLGVFISFDEEMLMYFNSLIVH